MTDPGKSGAGGTGKRSVDKRAADRRSAGKETGANTGRSSAGSAGRSGSGSAGRSSAGSAGRSGAAKGGRATDAGRQSASRAGRLAADDAGNGGKSASYDWSPEKPATRKWSVNKPIAGKRSPGDGKPIAGKRSGERPVAGQRFTDKPVGGRETASADAQPTVERRLTAGERNEQRRQERRAARKAEASGGGQRGGAGGGAPAGRRGAAGQGQSSAGVPVERSSGTTRSSGGAKSSRGVSAGQAVEPRSSDELDDSGRVPLAGERGGAEGVATGRERAPDARTGKGRAHRHKAAALDKPADDVYRAGFACFVGRPNAGKSTLTNAIIGQKIAITSSKPQTTRHIIRGILHRDNSQLVLVDTPGLHRPRTLLGERLNDLVKEVWSEVDVIGICFPADEKVGRGDRFIAAEMAELKATVIAVVTKVDLVDPARLAQHLLDVSELYDFADIVPVSAVSGHQVETLVDVIVKHLPESPQLYPAEMITDEPEQVLIAELIREAALEGVRDELPHSIAVLVEEMMVEGNLTKIFANLYIERPSQKSIVIGTAGARLKDVGTRARAEIEALLGRRVYLDLHVRVAKEWQRDPKQLRKLGF